MQLRALIAVRLSKVTDATTSPERQLETCRDLIRQRGWAEVGVAQDLDVSAGKTTPFTRPQLGEWLTNRAGEYDVIVVYRMDRLVRRLLDLADVIRWCQQNNVKLVSATESFLDLTAPFGDIIALLVAKVAEMELAAISERNTSAARHNLRAGKYRGGIPPWGYVPEQIDGDWRFVIDPAQAEVIHEVVKRVLAGEPMRAIAAYLNDRGIPSPRDTFATHQGRAAKGSQWHSGGLKRALSSPALLGYTTTLNGPLRADDGSPLTRAEPILTKETFDRLQVELADRENRKEPTKRTNSLLLQVIFCGAIRHKPECSRATPCDCPVCGGVGYKIVGSRGRRPRYRCVTMQEGHPCGNKSIFMDDCDNLVEGVLLKLLGDSERLERVWDTGSDHSAELAEVNDKLADLAGLIGTGVYAAGTPQRAVLDKRITELAARQAELAAQAVKPAGWIWKPVCSGSCPPSCDGQSPKHTGELFSDWWASQDVIARNVWLRSMGVRLTWNGDQMHLDFGDLRKMVENMRASGPVTKWLALLDSLPPGAVVEV